MPSVMSEFYLVSSSEWYIELSFDPMYYEYNPEISTLDGLIISSSSGSSLVKEGINFTNGDIIILTQDSLQNTVQFERSGDFLKLENFNIGIWETYYFGDIEYSQISSPIEGQSLVNYKYTCTYTHGETPFHDIENYRLIKDNSPNIGLETEAFTPVSGNGLFCGVVLDGSDNPVPGITIGYNCYAPEDICDHVINCAITDENGHFSENELSCQHYVEIFYFNFESIVFCDSVINIEPNIDNYFEFRLDTIFSGNKSVSVNPKLTFDTYPNPTDSDIRFNIQFNGYKFSDNILIKIYNMSGEIVKILPVKSYGSESCITYWDGICTNGSAASGQYICKLELNGKNVAELKLIITK